jgi:hypothetical protein
MSTNAVYREIETLSFGAPYSKAPRPEAANDNMVISDSPASEASVVFTPPIKSTQATSFEAKPVVGEGEPANRRPRIIFTRTDANGVVTRLGKNTTTDVVASNQEQTPTPDAATQPPQGEAKPVFPKYKLRSFQRDGKNIIRITKRRIHTYKNAEGKTMIRIVPSDDSEVRVNKRRPLQRRWLEAVPEAEFDVSTWLRHCVP